MSVVQLTVDGNLALGDVSSKIGDRVRDICEGFTKDMKKCHEKSI